jgi:hypothetical protein
MSFNLEPGSGAMSEYVSRMSFFFIETVLRRWMPNAPQALHDKSRSLSDNQRHGVQSFADHMLDGHAVEKRGQGPSGRPGKATAFLIGKLKDSLVNLPLYSPEKYLRKNGSNKELPSDFCRT